MKAKWPILDYSAYKDTAYLLHQWSQMVGKVRLRKSPWQNHSWHVALYLDAQGMTTGPIPYEGGIFEIKFDFTQHELKVRSSNGTRDRFSLGNQTVASFFEQLREKLDFIGIKVKITKTPNEIPDAIPFDQNTKRIPYLPNEAKNIWKALIQIHNVMTVFRSRFRGKNSPIHFFWGSFDLAYTRFSGATAPEFEGEVPNLAKEVMQEAYSHEVFSVGFWPGGEQFPKAVFYAYCYPNHPDFKNKKVQPEEAYWSDDLGEFILPYEAVQKAADPTKKLLDFLESTYKAATEVGSWDRNQLDCDFSSLEKKNSNITI
ncbi:MAG: DUF5996 family protein [Cyclobacteriaceae bacterium]|nr:DUF5996 family protein [Cyclobacteriaceae bacterium]